MPIYTYACQDCGSSLERRQGFNDEPLRTHDDCGGSLRRVIHPVGIVFKGSGFYNTDYKNGTGPKKAESESESTDAKTDGAKAESTTSENGSSTSASSNGSSGSSNSSSQSESKKGESKSEPKSAAPAATTP